MIPSIFFHLSFFALPIFKSVFSFVFSTTNLFNLHRQRNLASGSLVSVSYTHLDVYKRQEVSPYSGQIPAEIPW